MLGEEKEYTPCSQAMCEDPGLFGAYLEEDFGFLFEKLRKVREERTKGESRGREQKERTAQMCAPKNDTFHKNVVITDYTLLSKESLLFSTILSFLFGKKENDIEDHSQSICTHTPRKETHANGCVNVNEFSNGRITYTRVEERKEEYDSEYEEDKNVVLVEPCDGETYNQGGHKMKTSIKRDDKTGNKNITRKGQGGDYPNVKKKESLFFEQISFEKYKRVIEDTIRRDKITTYETSNVVIIIMNVEKYQNKLEQCQDILQLYYKFSISDDSEFLCFVTLHMMDTLQMLFQTYLKEANPCVETPLRDGTSLPLAVHVFPLHVNDIDKMSRERNTITHSSVRAYLSDDSCSMPIESFILTSLFSTLNEGEYKGAISEALKLAVLNDKKLFIKMKEKSGNYFRKRPQCLLRRCALIRRNLFQQGTSNGGLLKERNAKENHAYILQFGNTIGEAIKNVTEKLTSYYNHRSKRDYTNYGIYYELKILYVLQKVDMLLLIDIEQLMIKYKLKYKLEKIHCNYYARDIIYWLHRKYDHLWDNKIPLVYLQNVGEIHPDILIDVPINTVAQVLCPLICLSPYGITALQTTERKKRSIRCIKNRKEINNLDGITHFVIEKRKNIIKKHYVSLRSVGSKSEAIRVIYASCMSAENVWIENINLCFDVVLFINVMKFLKFPIELKRENDHIYEHTKGMKRNCLLIKGNIENSSFLFKNFLFQDSIKINIYNCGTVCRFLLPLLCLYICKQNLKAREKKKKPIKSIIVRGNIQMESNRIIKPLVKVLLKCFTYINVKYLKKKNFLPLKINIKKEIPKNAEIFYSCKLHISNYFSSQFVSAMLLISPFSDTNTCINLAFKKLRSNIRRISKIRVKLNKEEQYLVLRRRKNLYFSIEKGNNVVTLIRKRKEYLPFSCNSSGGIGETLFSTTSKAFIDLTIHVMKLWGVKIYVKNCSYFVIRERKNSLAYSRKRGNNNTCRDMIKMYQGQVTRNIFCKLVHSKVSKEKDMKYFFTFRKKRRIFICKEIVHGNNYSSQGDAKRKIEHEEKGELHKRSKRVIRKITSIGKYNISFREMYQINNDLGLYFYFIVGSIIMRKNCTILLALDFKNVDKVNVGNGYYKIKAIQWQKHVPNYFLLNVLLLLGVDMYVREDDEQGEGLEDAQYKENYRAKLKTRDETKCGAKKQIIYMLTSRKMDIMQSGMIKPILEYPCGKNRWRSLYKKYSIKYNPFDKIYVKFRSTEKKKKESSIKVVIDAENFSDDFFSLCVLFSYHLINSEQDILFKVKNIHNQNIKESVRVYNVVFILKLCFQNVLFISCDYNSIHISRMYHNVQNCLFHKYERKRKFKKLWNFNYETEIKLCNNSQYVINNKKIIYLYVDTKNDHRIVFMVTILSLILGNIVIDNTCQIEKSYPDFYYHAKKFLNLKVNYVTSSDITFHEFAAEAKTEADADVEKTTRVEGSSSQNSNSTRTSGSTSLRSAISARGQRDHEESYDFVNINRKREGDKNANVNGRGGSRNITPCLGKTIKHVHQVDPLWLMYSSRSTSPKRGIKIGEYGKTKKALSNEKDMNPVSNRYCNTYNERKFLSLDRKTNSIAIRKGSLKGSHKVWRNRKSGRLFLENVGKQGDGNKRDLYLPFDENYERKYKYEEILRDDVNIHYLARKVNHLNIHIICGMRNVGKSYLGKEIKNSFVIDIDEFILNGAINFDHISIDDFRYYEYVTFVSALYLSYCILTFRGGLHDTESGNKPAGNKPSEEGEKNIRRGKMTNKIKLVKNPYKGITNCGSFQYCKLENIFFCMREDVVFHNKKINRLYYWMKKNMMMESEFNVRSITIVLGGGIIEFCKSRHVLKKLKNVILIRRSKEEVYDICMNDKMKPHLSGNLREIINRRYFLFDSLNCFHFSIPEETTLKKHIHNLSESRNDLIVRSFIHFFNYMFFLKPSITMFHSNRILSFRLKDFVCFDCKAMLSSYDMVEIIVGMREEWLFTAENAEKERKEEKLLELAIFLIRSFTSKPIIIKFDKLVIPKLCRTQNGRREPNGKLRKDEVCFPYNYSIRDYYKYKINMFDIDVKFLKRINNFLLCKEENIFLIISKDRNEMEKAKIEKDLSKMDTFHADLIKLTYSFASKSDRQFLHLIIMDYYKDILKDRNVHYSTYINNDKGEEITLYTSYRRSPFVFLHNNVTSLKHYNTFLSNIKKQNIKREDQIGEGKNGEDHQPPRKRKKRWKQLMFTNLVMISYSVLLLLPHRCFTSSSLTGAKIERKWKMDINNKSSENRARAQHKWKTEQCKYMTPNLGKVPRGTKLTCNFNQPRKNLHRRII
ncbi:pentafunctional AROM polypeptide, putative (AROM) [Plasmodium ovale curtisi]|uniref:Pentafunctional AROM polypeptide, putative (AROM) n=1 Tax=Plasmodium ovale curtisi TaxID=864141 RepID=A0A1A8VMX5_PLAOA|nr:pentafunctional AROM polypeptide, putative (AROM) [Plasmodium ovale curtisi]